MHVHQLIRTVCHSRKASKIVASVGVVALASLLCAGSDQLHQAAPDATAHATAPSAVTHPLPYGPKSVVALHASYMTFGRRQSLRSINDTASLPVKSTGLTSVTPTPSPKPQPQSGPGENVYPYGSCTWWADQRYFQLHGVFVPWHSQADAWQWTARAYQYGWHVSNTPILGAIIDLQPGVQGAWGNGHVAVVEQILSNGHVIASNMAWGANPYQVVDVEFAPDPGVTFIYQ